MQAANPDRANAGFRPDIQGLRAIAVLAVLAFHLWPIRAPGGYVGVDVFFVVSGFLITSHLRREVSATGWVSLPSFWARRARRLLPASLLVLLAVAVATLLFVPHGFWSRYFSEIGASALYVENWLLAGNAVDYLAAANVPSALQHFWSLSAEEQFYLLWPVLIVLTLVFARKSSPLARMRALGVVLGAVTVASLVFSIVGTAQFPSAAYFVTPTRAWEFGAGALLAFAPQLSGRRWVAALGWLGVVGILVGVFLYGPATPFPGTAALLPVLSTVVVIAASSAAQRWAVPRVLAWRPVQYIGGISYSLYLWHWPLIVIVPFVLMRPLGTRDKVIILVASFVLASLSKVLVEDRVRRARVLTRSRPRRTLLSALAAMALVLAVSVVGGMQGAASPVAVPEASAEPAGCFGAEATVPSHHCEPTSPSDFAAAAAFARTDTSDGPDPKDPPNFRCEEEPGGSALKTCEFGKYAHPTRTVALLGDSHMGHYLGAFEKIASDLHWNVYTYFKSACSGTGDSSVVLLARPYDQEPCAVWGRAAAADILHNHAIDAVFTANVALAYSVATQNSPIGITPYVDLWKKFTSAGIHVFVLSDTPLLIVGDVPNCLESTKSVDACSVNAAQSFVPNAMQSAVVAARSSAVTYLDMEPRFCIDGECPPFIGGVVVYSDSGHLTKTYSTTLAPFIEAAVATAAKTPAP